MRLLDIDLDFFINDIANFRSDVGDRLDDSEYYTWNAERVERFLEDQCGLSKNNKIKGKIIEHHDEAFYYWRDLIGEGLLNTPFDVIHIDAHADLGLGDASWVYIMQNLLHMTLEERIHPEKFRYESNLQKFSYANYLAFAIGCRWIKTLTFVTHPNWFNDLPYLLFKDLNDESGFIQLRKYNKRLSLDVDSVKRNKPLDLEPEVPFYIVPYDKFSNVENIDFVCLSQSPGFTPKTADALIPIISKYIDLN